MSDDSVANVLLDSLNEPDSEMDERAVRAVAAFALVIYNGDRGDVTISHSASHRSDMVAPNERVRLALRRLWGDLHAFVERRLDEFAVESGLRRRDEEGD